MLKGWKMTTAPPRGEPARGASEAGRRKKKKGRLAGWFTSVSGVLASLATIVAAVASVLAAHQTARVNQLTIVVHQQQQKLAAKSQQAPGKSGQGTPVQSGSSGGASAPGSTYLSALQPTVNNGGFNTSSQIMSAKSYTDSVTLYCIPADGQGEPADAFDVAGHSLFTAVVGIPDDTSDVTSVNETVVFSNQSGTALMSPVTVSLGHPATVRLNISGVTQLAVTCTGVNTQSQQSDNGNPVTLGDAQISS
jgi:hypothetical protein